MTLTGAGWYCWKTVLIATAQTLLFSTGAFGQIDSQSPSDLINFLTYQSNRPRESKTRAVFFTCRVDNPEAADYRRAAQSLVKLGALAIPEIEQTLGSIEKHGRDSPFASNPGWLLHAYARLTGIKGFERLHRMLGDPKLSFLQNSLDDSAALSLGLTSYVSQTRIPIGFRCRPSQPRDTLDEWILAWGKDDRQSFEANLGPGAKEALASLLRGRTWLDMRNDMWPGKLRESFAVGYKLQVEGPWSEPEETLEHDGLDDRPATRPSRVDIDTLLTTASGETCGTIRIKFVNTGPAASGPYLIDNRDIAQLMHLTALCAQR